MQIFRCRKVPLVAALRQRRFVECRPDAREKRELHVAIEFERALGLVLDRLHDLGFIVIWVECCCDIRCDRAQYDDHCEQWLNDKPDDFSHCRFAFRAIRDPRSIETMVRRSYMERVKGIEPSYAAWEAAVLPLNYARGWYAMLSRPCGGRQAVPWRVARRC